MDVSIAHVEGVRKFGALDSCHLPGSAHPDRRNHPRCDDGTAPTHYAGGSDNQPGEAASTMTVDSSHQRQRLPRGARRAQLIGAAQEVFALNGYHATAMDEIAITAGVSKPVLYQHFPGKLDLYLAILDSHIADLLSTVGNALQDENQGNKERIKAAMAAFFAFVDRADQPFRLVFESDLTNEQAVRDRVERLDNQLAAMVAELIAKDTGMTPDQTHLLGAAMTGMAQTTARQWLANGRTPSRDQAVELMLNLAWRGIRSIPRVEDAIDLTLQDAVDHEVGLPTSS